MGMGGMPGGGMPQQQPNFQRNNTMPAANTAKLSNNADLNEANKLKDQAGKLYQEKQYEKACDLYYESINTIRFSDSLKSN